VNLLKTKFKHFLIAGVILFLAVFIYVNLSQKSVQNSSAATEVKKTDLKLESKSVDTSSNEKQAKEKLEKLKSLEAKSKSSIERYKKMLTIQSIIEARLVLQLELIEQAKNRLTHLDQLNQENVLTEEDGVLARTQLTSAEKLAETIRNDREKVVKRIEEQKLICQKDEQELKNFKKEL
jgi:hypothetical protein